MKKLRKALNMFRQIVSCILNYYRTQYDSKWSEIKTVQICRCKILQLRVYCLWSTTSRSSHKRSDGTVPCHGGFNKIITFSFCSVSEVAAVGWQRWVKCNLSIQCDDTHTQIHRIPPKNILMETYWTCLRSSNAEIWT